MKLKTAIFSIALVTASVANAQSSADSVRAQLAGMGYTNIEIERSASTYSVEAYRNGQKRDITYDATTGEILSDRSYRESSNDRTARNNDESNDSSSNDDRSNDESNSSSSNDDRSNDESNSSSSNDDRSNDESNDSSSNDDRSNDESNDSSSNDDRSNDEGSDDRSNDED